jgi:intracellular septation protein
VAQAKSPDTRGSDPSGVPRTAPTPAGETIAVTSLAAPPATGDVGLKLLIELAPLVLFFVVYARGDIFAATGVLMVATIVSLAAAKFVLGKVTVMPIITAAFVLVFGSLTLWFSNETFIKIKPTVVYVCLALPLLGGLLFGKSLLSHVLGEAIALNDSGWRALTLRWGIFFLLLALLNEIVWRNFSTATWVSMKSFGFIPLTLVFAACQVPLMMRHKTQPQLGDEDRG